MRPPVLVYLRRITPLALVGLLTAAGPPGRTPAGRPVDFAREVAPLVRAHCLGCHGPDRPRGGLRLDNRAGLRKGGRSVPVVRPGNAAGSRLVRAVSGTAGKLVMPPKGRRRLTAGEVALLRAWVDQGARWPEGLVLAAPRHWAFRPIGRPSPPAVRRRGWVRNPIDAFVLARLEKEGIGPSPEADPVTLLRRVTLDLTGLPPTPREVDDFLADTSPTAYEKVVDRLLASPHYGEKWARPWLDLSHYGDTDGYLTDQRRPAAWRWRQWLVEALNADLPFDQLTVRQLAGDLLPRPTPEERLGTGFLRNTLSNREGGADLEEYRVEQVVDRTMMVGAGWLGLTVGCARCHDHKYDPISQEEFFRLYAFFDSADEVNVDVPLPGETERYLAARPAYDRRRAVLLAPVRKDVEELQARWERKLLEAYSRPGKDHVWDRQWEVLGLIWGGHLGEGQLEGTEIVKLPRARRTPDQQERLLDYFLARGEVIDPERFRALKLAGLAGKLEKLRASLPKPTRAPVMREALTPRRAYVHLRGDFRSRGPEVPPDTPACLPPMPEKSPRNRLGLARWLVAAENPLTARVAVNRAWQEFFGRGLVSTSGDFGTRGEAPSHPELLDWLAAEYRAGGWKTKALHRLIVTSATYRQSSRARPGLRGRDPDNRLLARQASLRLSADQVRDVSLAVSGLLDRRVGGPSVFPPQPGSVAAEGFENTWVASKGNDRYRRGLYTFLQRLSPFAQGVTFDAPATNSICTRRERSNTPLQALTLLNDPVFFEAARTFAARVLREKKGETERITHAFRLALARPPTPAERERLHAYYREQIAILREERGSARKMSPRGVEGVGEVEGGAWTGVCSVLLNLHEFITRD